jgi:hypothetical protein
VIDYRLRLAGTGLYSVYGREITGRTLEDVYNSAAVDYWRRELDKVVTERRPGVGVHSLAWKGSPHMSILWLRLPLASNGKDVDMILGYDAVVGARRPPTSTAASAPPDVASRVSRPGAPRSPWLSLLRGFAAYCPRLDSSFSRLGGGAG